MVLSSLLDGVIVPVVAVQISLYFIVPSAYSHTNVNLPLSEVNPESECKSCDNSRIIDGEPVARGEFPYMAALQGWSMKTFCGGVIVKENKVLTACHCLCHYQEGVKPRLKSYRYMSVVVGSVKDIDYEFDETFVQRCHIDRLYKHPECSKLRTGWTYDYGLVRVESHFKVIPNLVEIYPLPLYRLLNKSISVMQDEAAECYGVGWGATREGGGTTNNLLKVALTLLKPDECKDRIRRAARMVDSALKFTNATQLCTLGVGHKDACQGDSGGPLLCYNSDTDNLILYATVSWGIGCGRTGVPGIWARLDVAEDWIRKTLASGNLNVGNFFVVVTSLFVLNKILCPVLLL